MPIFLGILSLIAFSSESPVIAVVVFVCYASYLYDARSATKALAIAVLFSGTFYSWELATYISFSSNEVSSFLSLSNLVSVALYFYFVILFCFSGYLLFLMRGIPSYLWSLLALPSVFTLLEWFKATVFTGFPSQQISHLFVDFLDVEFAFFGELGVSFLFYFVVGLFHQCWQLLSKKRFFFVIVVGSLFLVCLIIHLLASSKFYVPTPEASKGGLLIRAINGQVGLNDKNSLSASEERMKLYQGLANLHPKPALVLAPEGSVEFTLKNTQSLLLMALLS